MCVERIAVDFIPMEKRTERKRKETISMFIYDTSQIHFNNVSHGGGGEGWGGEGTAGGLNYIFKFKKME